jgi:hypothetical protein
LSLDFFAECFGAKSIAIGDLVRVEVPLALTVKSTIFRDVAILVSTKYELYVS